MATGQYPDAEQTLLTAMSLQPEKPLPAVAFVSLSDKFQVNEEKLKTALQLMRKFSLENNDEEKYQVYTLKLLNLSVRTNCPVEEIRNLHHLLDPQVISQEENFNMFMSFYDRGADMKEEEIAFLFENLHAKILKFSGNLDCDQYAFDLYKKYCDLGYQSDRLCQLFDAANSIFINSPEAWILHSELLNLIQLEFCTKLANSFEMPRLDENSVKMLQNLANLPDDGRSVKPTVRNISNSILYFTGKFHERDFERSSKVEFVDEAKLHQSKLISAFSVHSRDYLLGLIILYIQSLTKSKLDSSMVKVDDIQGMIEFSGKLSRQAKIHLSTVLTFIKIRGFQNLSKRIFSDEILEVCVQLESSLNESSPVSENVLDKRIEKIRVASIESLIFKNQSGEAIEALQSIPHWSSSFCYLKALLTNEIMDRAQKYRQKLEWIDKGLKIDNEHFDLMVLQLSTMLKRLLRLRSDEKDAKESILDSCFEQIELLERLDPFSYEVQYVYGVYFYCSDFCQDALESLEECFCSNELHLKSIKFYGKILFESGSYEALVNFYGRRLACFDSNKQYLIWLRLAVELFSIGEYTFAAECVSHCRSRNRRKHSSWLLIAAIFYKTKSNQSSLNCGLEAMKLIQLEDTFLVDAYQSNVELQLGSFIVASSRLNLGNFNFANDDFTTALALNRDCLLVICEKVMTLHRLFAVAVGSGTHDKASKELFQEALSLSFEAVEKFPLEPMAWKVLGDTLMQSDMFSGPVDFEIPGHVQGKQSRTIRVNKSDMVHLAYQCFRNVIRYSPEKNCAWAWLALSKCCFVLKSNTFLEQALLYGKIAVSLDDTNQELWLYLGSLAASSAIAQYSLAQHCFLEAYELNEDNITPLGFLGMLFLKTGKGQSAETVFGLIQQSDPSNPLNLLYNQYQKPNSDFAKPKYVLNTLEALDEEPLPSQILMMVENLLSSISPPEQELRFRMLNLISSLSMNHNGLKKSNVFIAQLLLGVFYANLDLHKVAIKCFLDLSNSKFSTILKSILRILLKNRLYLCSKNSVHRIYDSVVPSTNCEKLSVQYQKQYYKTLNPQYLIQLFFELIKSHQYRPAIQLRAKIVTFGTVQAQRNFCLDCCRIIQLTFEDDFNSVISIAQKIIHRKPWLATNWSLFIYSLRFYSKAKNKASTPEYSGQIMDLAPILSKFCSWEFLSTIVQLLPYHKHDRDALNGLVSTVRQVGIVVPENWEDCLYDSGSEDSKLD